jgi:hypothetical protein
VLVLLERVSDAQRMASKELREQLANDPRKNGKKKRKREDGNGDGNNDDEGGDYNAKGGILERGGAEKAKKQHDHRGKVSKGKSSRKGI